MSERITNRLLKAGWYEFTKRPEATTNIAYVAENMMIYVPEAGIKIEDFMDAFVKDEAYRLVREDQIPVPDPYESHLAPWELDLLNGGRSDDE
jgi:hypothetical protein